MNRSVEGLLSAASTFRREAHGIFGDREEAGASRVFHLTGSYERLSKLSLKQDDMLRQALRCTEHSIYRAAHVLAWAAAVDYLQEYVAADKFAALRAARPNWKFKDLEELRETQGEYAIIEAMKVADLISKGEMKAFHGLLSKRNECAHPSNYYPDLNQTLGFIAEIMERIKLLQGKRSATP